MDPILSETPADLRAWLAENHATADFLRVGFYKKGSGRRSITWPESVDEAPATAGSTASARASTPRAT